MSYHPSKTSELAQSVMWTLHMKEDFSDVQRCKELLEKKKEEMESPYVLPGLPFRCDVTLTQFRSIPLIMIRPSASNGKGILYLHGGAYIYQLYPEQLLYMDLLALKTGRMIAVPLYPLAPKHTVEETIAFLPDLYAQLRTQVSDLTVMGDSAGGGLAIALCEALPTYGLAQPEQLIVYSPWLDVSMSNPLTASLEEVDPILSATGLRLCGEAWAGERDLQDPWVSPWYGDTASLPKTTIFVGTHEIFLADVRDFYLRLRQQEQDVTLHVGIDQMHVYPFYPTKEGRVVLKRVIELLK